MGHHSPEARLSTSEERRSPVMESGAVGYKHSFTFWCHHRLHHTWLKVHPTYCAVQLVIFTQLQREVCPMNSCFLGLIPCKCIILVSVQNQTISFPNDPRLFSFKKNTKIKVNSCVSLMMFTDQCKRHESRVTIKSLMKHPDWRTSFIYTHGINVSFSFR